MGAIRGLNRVRLEDGAILHLDGGFTVKTINGQTEVQYLLGAITLVDRELAVAARRNDAASMLDASERLDTLKTCLVRALRDGGAL